MCDEEMSAALVCLETGWTFEEYIGQPIVFLESIRMLKLSQAEELKRKNYGNDH